MTYARNYWTKKNMSRIICMTVLFALALGEPLQLETCDSTVGKVVDAAVTGCKFVNGRYILKRGTNVGIEIKFDTDKEVTNVNAAVKGIINGMPIPYPVPNADGCKVLQCPLQKGGPYSYTATLPVSHLYPKVVVTVQWALENEDKEFIACVRIPAKIE